MRSLQQKNNTSQQPVPGLSMLVHIQNEEKRLPAFFQHIKSFIDDVVIVDDYSTDRSEEICKRYGARVYKFRADNFAAKNNFGQPKCKHPWVLLMDLDERLDDDLKDAIREIVARNPPEDIFCIRRKEYFMYQEYTIGWHRRLFRRDTTRWEGIIHDQPVPLKPEGGIGYIRTGYELHYKPQHVDSIVKKIGYYTDLEVNQLKPMSRIRTILMMLAMPIYIFCMLMFYGRYVKGGVGGLVFAVNSSFYVFVLYAKYYERNFVKPRVMPYE